MKRTLSVLLLFLAFYSPLDSFAQTKNKLTSVSPGKTQTIKWMGPRQFDVGSGSKTFLQIHEGTLNEYGNPVYFGNEPAQGSSVKVQVLVHASQPATSSESIYIDKTSLSNYISAEATVSYDQGKPVTVYSFVPLFIGSNGSIEKVTEFSLNFSYSGSVNRNSSNQRQHAPSSVLASGKWYKIGVVRDGMYKLTKGFLDSLGLKTDNIDPRSLRVYGSGGGTLPLSNLAFRHDDLPQNAIKVYGEQDGKFDQGDYAVFYGKGQHTWKFDSISQRYTHNYNIYSDTTYYFITADSLLNIPGKRIEIRSQVTTSPTHQVTTFDDYVFHEKENVNLLKSGRLWLGESFDLVTSYDFSFNFPDIDNSEPVYVKAEAASRSCGTSSTFSFTGGNLNLSITPDALPTSVCGCYFCEYAKLKNAETSFIPTSAQIDINVNFVKGSGTALGWLNYIELNARRHLKFNGSPLFFRDKKSVGTGFTSTFSVQGVNQSIEIWDITDPVNAVQQSISQSGNTVSFNYSSDILRQYAAFGQNLASPFKFGKVANQNLHGLPMADYVIITHPDFKEQAERLADLHRDQDSMSVHVVSVYEVFNEFGSGSEDITAVKDFLKMFYDRSTPENKLKYVLLFGDGSYSYKSTTGNSDFVPCYESALSLEPVRSYVSDDYFALLDDNESDGLGELVDVGIGRLPVQNKNEAKNVVDKIEAYMAPFSMASLTATGCTNVSSGSNYGDWRNSITFTADDDENDHVSEAESLVAMLDTMQSAGFFNLDKIYFDAYKEESTAGGKRYPEVQNAINQRVQRGGLIMNYTGHGGEVGWAHERVLQVPDINNWSNNPRLPLFITATCEFSKFDDPARVSAGELVLLNKSGGGIALLTTTRLVFGSFNFILNKNFYLNAFKKENGEQLRLGDICRITKNASANSSSNNHRNFTLLGDPAIKLAYPKYKVKTSLVNGHDPAVIIDTLKALAKVTVKGFVADDSGNKMTSFNGIVYPTVYDKEMTITTLGNDGQNTRSFKLRKNVIYRGKASVKNGDFSFTFIVPKDIAYEYGQGRFSYYAVSDMGDASGAFENVIIGGALENPPADNEGPTVDLYLNDKKFVVGGTTDESPNLIAEIIDSSGVNTVGNGIGHDITAILDKNTDKVIVLNDYYESDLDSYQKGTVRYPFDRLSEGKHTLTFKIWDVYNNSEEVNTEFVVAQSANLALKHVLNYPNPFTTHTTFMFEHNQPCMSLDVTVQVFTVSGKLVKTLAQKVKCEGYRSDSIEWDGLDEYGDKLGKGVYVYRLKVKSEDGTFADKYEKLVILN